MRNRVIEGNDSIQSVQLQQLIDRIRNEIISNAQIEARKIIASAEAVAAEIKEAALKESKDIIATAENNAETLIASAKSSIIRATNLYISRIKRSLEEELIVKSIGGITSDLMKNQEFMREILDAIVIFSTRSEIFDGSNLRVYTPNTLRAIISPIIEAIGQKNGIVLHLDDLESQSIILKKEGSDLLMRISDESIKEGLKRELGSQLGKLIFKDIVIDNISIDSNSQEKNAE